MKIPDELREKLQAETKANIEDKLSRLRKRTAHNVFLEDKSIPTREHAYYKEQVLLGIQLYEDLLPGIKKVLGNIKKNYVPEIWEQNAITAVYLLSAKTFTNLQTIIHLAKHGRNFEIMDLARSGMESLDLAFLFLEKGQDARISNWFEGKIIDNDKAREAFHKAINAEKISVEVLPVYEMKTQVYRIYSHYSHSAYSAILELINLFSENYDFEDISGYYYTNKNMDNTIKNLAISLLLELKNVYTKHNNKDGIAEVDKLLATLGNYMATPEEVATVVKNLKSAK